MYKIATYTICKNEISHVEKWFETVKQADCIYILDTGSTDGTLEKLQELEKENEKFHLYQKSYEIFSFGDAWNTILEKIPEDVDFVFRIDMDQYLTNRYWYFELQLYFMNFKPDLSKPCEFYVQMYEKNFARIENHPQIATRNVRWAGDIHERNYFPGITRDKIITGIVPLILFHNQKYPTTNNTGIPGCQKRYDFYKMLAIEQFKKSPTVFNFIHYMMVEESMSELIYKAVLYELGEEEFEYCDPITTQDVDFKPQLIDLISAYLFTLLAKRSLTNYQEREEEDPIQNKDKDCVAYVTNLIERFTTEITDNKLVLNKKFQNLTDLVDHIKNYVNKFNNDIRGLHV